jgi:glyoxylase-like metal-dependent hydrolase (beta-lactamase superfamily II)
LFASYAYGQQYGVEPAELELIKLADDLCVIDNECVPANQTTLVTDAGIILVHDKYAVDHASVMAHLFRVTDGDIVAHVPQHRVLAAGDILAYAGKTLPPELIDYDGGGSAREWPATMDRAMALAFDRVVPGHGVVTSKPEMRRYRDNPQRLITRVRDMVARTNTREEIERMLRLEFAWPDRARAEWSRRRHQGRAAVVGSGSV